MYEDDPDYVKACRFADPESLYELNSLSDACRKKNESVWLQQANELLSVKNKESVHEAKEIYSYISKWKNCDIELAKCDEVLSAIEKEEKRSIQSKNKKLRALGSVAVLVVLLCLGCFLFYKNGINSKYNKAIELMETGDYNEAKLVFSSLDDYKGSDILVMECDYLYAIEQFRAGYYKEAFNLFKTLDGYSDSVSYMDKCNDAFVEEMRNKEVKGTISWQEKNEKINIESIKYKFNKETLRITIDLEAYKTVEITIEGTQNKKTYFDKWVKSGRNTIETSIPMQDLSIIEYNPHFLFTDGIDYGWGWMKNIKVFSQSEDLYGEKIFE